MVTAVAAFAAVVSYSHIYDLGRAHGQAGTAARLLPLSVDGLILAASLVMLHEARNRRPAPTLARPCSASAWRRRWRRTSPTAPGSGGPARSSRRGRAVAFIGAAEMALGLVRRAGPAHPLPHP